MKEVNEIAAEVKSVKEVVILLVNYNSYYNAIQDNYCMYSM
jgi:hypothetical protein